MSRILPIFSANMTAYQAAAKRAGFNKTACAKRAGMSKGHWADMLNGKIPSPGVWTAQRIADALCVTIDALCTFDPAIRSATAIGVERLFRQMARDKSLRSATNTNAAEQRHFYKSQAKSGKDAALAKAQPAHR
jgi:hypothetical protein